MSSENEINQNDREAANSNAVPGQQKADRDTAALADNATGRESGLNNASPTPPLEVQTRLDKAAEESDKLDSAERTNDSTIDPTKPEEDILKGFHGG